MILWGISGLLIIICSYLVISILRPKNFLTGFIYFLLVSFAQIVLTTEILSPFYLLNELNFLLLQIITLGITVFYWFKNNRPLFKMTPIVTFKRIFKSLVSDKALIVLGAGFAVFITVSLFLCIVMDITSGDAEIYHVARSYMWSFNHSINHFETHQVRMTVFPVNSEILYCWVIMFTKNSLYLGLFSFAGYIMSISALFGLMNRFSINRRLWVIFIITSLASVIVQPSGTETDLITAGLVLSSMYLFRESIKGITQKENNNLSVIFMSALSYALALGTKTTAFFMVPAIGLFMIYNSYKILGKKDFIRPFLYFLGFGTINFLIFSAYNYVGNIIWFGNILGATNTIELHKNSYGLRGAVANLIKNFTLFFDFTGFTWNEKIGEIIIPARDNLLEFLHLSSIPDGINSGDSTKLNNTLIEPSMGTGVIGLLVFIPSLFISVIKPVFCKDRNTTECFLYAVMFLVTMVIMSFSIVFMTYNNRFIASFAVVCAPITAYSYFKKRCGIIKWLIVLFAMFYLTLVSIHIWSRPAISVFDALFIKHQTLSEIRARNEWSVYKMDTDLYPLENMLSNTIRNYPKETKFVIFPSNSTHLTYLLKLIEDGYNIDFKLIETFDFNDFENYDIIILETKGQSTNVAYKFKENINKYKLAKNGDIAFLNNQDEKNCIYYTANKIITSGSGATPTGTQCIINPDYLARNNYKIYDIVYDMPSSPFQEQIPNYILFKKLENNT